MIRNYYIILVNPKISTIYLLVLPTYTTMSRSASAYQSLFLQPPLFSWHNPKKKERIPESTTTTKSDAPRSPLLRPLSTQEAWSIESENSPPPSSSSSSEPPPYLFPECPGICLFSLLLRLAPDQTFIITVGIYVRIAGKKVLILLQSQS